MNNRVNIESLRDAEANERAKIIAMANQYFDEIYRSEEKRPSALEALNVLIGRIENLK